MIFEKKKIFFVSKENVINKLDLLIFFLLV